MPVGGAPFKGLQLCGCGFPAERELGFALGVAERLSLRDNLVQALYRTL
jgi:hypothetical protein